MEDLSGDSVFFKDDTDQIFHTYSTFGRGREQFLGAYSFLDVTPKGRNENGPYHTLGDWLRPKKYVWQRRHGGRQRKISLTGMRLFGSQVSNHAAGSAAIHGRPFRCGTGPKHSDSKGEKLCRPQMRKVIPQKLATPLREM
jgi:hypothetical protein